MEYINGPFFTEEEGLNLWYLASAIAGNFENSGNSFKYNILDSESPAGKIKILEICVGIQKL
jgi:hypothetical protein